MALLYFTDEFEKRYNCTFYNYEDRPFAKRSDVVTGCALLSIFVIECMLYIPCIIVMFDKDLIKFSCYKLMIYLGILDINKALFNGLWAGIVSVTGNVFCAWPSIAYWVGNLNGMVWKTKSPVTVLLAFNQCLEAYNPKWANFLFKDKRVFIWMGLPWIWSGRDFLIGPPGMYNPINSLIMYNPHGGYYEDPQKLYSNTTVFYNNAFCAISIVVIYGQLGIMFHFRSKQTNIKTAGQAGAFGQIFLIAAMLFYISTEFLVIQYVKLPEIWTHILHFSMALFDGLPAVLYLTLNKTMRKKVAKLFGFRRHRTDRINSTVRLPNFQNSTRVF